MGNFFIRRPIVAMVISIVTVIVGGVSLSRLPISQYPDITPPTILSVACIGNAQQIVVNFSEEMDPNSAQEPSNYFFDGGAQIVAALLSADGKSVTLSLDTPSPSGNGQHLSQPCEPFKVDGTK